MKRLLHSVTTLNLPIILALLTWAPACTFAQVSNPSAATPAVSLSVATASGPASALASGTAVTLSATVNQGSGKLAHGIVRFCDVTYTKVCTHENLIGHAQLMLNGTASVKTIPAPGNHTYQAVLYGQRLFTFQVSNTLAVTVTAPAATGNTGNTGNAGSVTSIAGGTLAAASSIVQAGTPGNYTVSAKIVTTGAMQPTGSVSFVDTTTGKTIGSAPLGPVTSLLSFASSTLPTGVISGNSSVATGDFNKDGKQDIALVGSDSNSVVILLGNGDGTFTAAPVAMLPINGIYQMKVADFNQDGNPDLALVNLLNNQIDLLLGKGDGTFTQGAEIYAGGGPIGVTIADFNGDGIPDIIRANTYGGTVTFLAGNGDGTFTPGWQAYLTSYNPVIPIAGDFNGDGKMDFAVTILNGQALSILMGNGDGTFTQAPDVAVGNRPGFLVAGDFNADGKLDLAVTNQTDNTVSVLLGKGDGTFTVKSPIATPAGTVDIGVADFNGDGKLDLAVSATTANTVSILLGAGDGTFTTSQTAPAGTSPYGLAVADFNGDGSPDVVTANTVNAATVVLSKVSQTASATLSGIAVVGTGLHTVNAVYSGDNNYVSATSALTTLTGQATPTTLALYSTNYLPMYGQQIYLCAALGVTNGGNSTTSNGDPVSFAFNGKVIGTAALNGGWACLPYTALPTGFDVITATYAGDASLSGSTAQTAVLVWKWFF